MPTGKEWYEEIIEMQRKAFELAKTPYMDGFQDLLNNVLKEHLPAYKNVWDVTEEQQTQTQKDINARFFTEKHNIILKANIPNLMKEELSVKISGTSLYLRGKTKQGEHEGSFNYVLNIPESVIQEPLRATYEKNVLTIVFVRREESFQDINIEFQNDK